MNIVDKTRRVNFLMEDKTLSYIQSRLGLQSLASVSRRLLLLYVNDQETREKVKSLDCDTQSGYESECSQ